MIRARATGPGPRTVALPLAAPLFACLLAVAVAACGTVAPAGTSSRSAPPSTASVSAPAGSLDPDASPDPWPGTTVLAVIALGAADGEIQKAKDDLQTAVDHEDLKAMWGAADGLAKMIDGLMPNLDRLDFYPLTKPVGQLYRTAFPELADGAKQVRDSITSGDTAGVESGFQLFAKGAEDYRPIRQQIAALVEQAIVQQRLYVK
jgi:hypothetical protein